MRTPTRVAATVLLGLLAGECTSSPSTGVTEVPANRPARSSTTSAGSTTVPPATPAGVVAAAVDSLAETGTYAFEVQIFLTVESEPTEIELEGWVDGADRELVMTIGEQSVTTRVVDGVATVEKDGETVEVPLTEAGSAPSILILKSISNASFETDTTITGELDAADLASSDYEVTGEASITVRLTPEGELAGYSMSSDVNAWSVDVKFLDIGERPKS